jgi:hypothetical protein
VDADRHTRDGQRPLFAPIPGSATIWGAGDISVTTSSNTYDSLVAVYGPLP